MIRTVLFCGLYAILNVGGAALIKWNLKGRSLSVFSEWVSFIFQIPVLIAFCIIFLSALVMFKTLSTGNFSFAIPVATGINFILTVIVGHYIFRDQLTFMSMIGFSLIISGIIILSLIPQNHI